MRISSRLAAFVAGLLLTISATVHAQTPLGQPTLDEKKIQIWCATARFVYNDNGRSNLNNALNCGGTLKEFEASIRTDSQRVYSRLYQPLEGKGVMYKGLGNDQSRLSKLTTEIIRTLEASPARRKDPARMAQVQRLKQSFAAYINQGTPMPEDIGQVEAAASGETFDTTATAGTDVETESMVADETSDAGTSSAPTRASADSPMTRLFGPIALILSLLSLVLWFLERRVLRNHIEDLRNRSSRHRTELESIKSGDFASSMTSSDSTKEISFTQRRQIEELVEKLVQQRLAETQPHGRGAASPEPALPLVKQSGNRASQAQSFNVGGNASSGRGTTAPAPAAPQAKPTPPVAAAPPQPSPEAPIAAPIPAGSPAAAPRDEFDSLVPPVQLPHPTQTPVPVVPPAPEAPVPHVPEPLPVGKFYVKVPVNGGFSDYDLHTTAQHDSIYEITPDPQRPDVASFRINPNPAVHAYAIQSAQYSLREACRYEPPTGAVGRIVTDEPGQLRKVGTTWQIEHKASIRFE
ncbi:hypothetical protein F0P96_14445 [Hymenobacter busanensis]|uniref:Uncharacterized protein n=1 Tax=Hymenobacter busanensis TaxID=2607656 RepID=A0A7L4ZYP1_9BACT|nr:hypothetical protein [Hymenobacter busanensis]KAA9331440.1 hypothetical protein F0P96_14445 [Hymenobacter busanensis]QHJ08594.1 hypothetical protein GUY19_15375 [Hymenobacter busanensis]